MSSFLVAPSILSADFANLQREVESVARAGADWIHVDVMDGHFVPNLTIGAPVVKALKPVSSLPLDVHLMIEQPEKYIKDFARAGADYLTIHIESTPKASVVLEEIRSLGIKPGISLRPSTKVEEIFSCLPLVDLVLVMTVEPGFGGQSFMSDQVPKLKVLRQKLEEIGSQALLEVDGGINKETALMVKEADVLVAGNYIFSGDYSERIQSLKSVQRK